MLSFEITLIQAFYGLKGMPSERSNLKHISKTKGSMGMIKGLWVESRGLYVCAPFKDYALRPSPKNTHSKRL